MPLDLSISVETIPSHEYDGALLYLFCAKASRPPDAGLLCTAVSSKRTNLVSSAAINNIDAVLYHLSSVSTIQCSLCRFFFNAVGRFFVFCFVFFWLLQVPAAAVEGSATEAPVAAPAPESRRGNHDVTQEHLAVQVGGNPRLWTVVVRRGGGGIGRYSLFSIFFIYQPVM